MKHVSHVITGLLFFLLIFEAGILQADQKNHQSLFKIERNTNANFIQYDAQIGSDGKLDRKLPVVAYWIRLAEQGQKEELSRIQNKFAYGFKADLDRASDTVKLEMAADIGRSIIVVHDNMTYQATAKINGKLSRIIKIYIHATGKGLSTTVDYIQLHGIDMETGDNAFEQFVP
jgi:hypothetical protein